jgi:hypothetical protein
VFETKARQNVRPFLSHGVHVATAGVGKAHRHLDRSKYRHMSLNIVAQSSPYASPIIAIGSSSSRITTARDVIRCGSP